MSKFSNTMLSFGLAALTLAGCCERKMYDMHGSPLKSKAVKSFFKTHHGVTGPEFNAIQIKKETADYITKKGKVKKDSLRNAVYFRYTKGDTILAGRAIREPHQVLAVNDIDSVMFARKDTNGVIHRTVIFKGVRTESVEAPNNIVLYQKRQISRMNDAVPYVSKMLRKIHHIEPAAVDVTGDYKNTWDRYQEALQEQMGYTGKVLSAHQAVKPF